MIVHHAQAITMVDAVLALATCDPAVDNGRVLRSVSYLAERHA